MSEYKTEAFQNFYNSDWDTRFVTEVYSQASSFMSQLRRSTYDDDTMDVVIDFITYSKLHAPFHEKALWEAVEYYIKQERLRQQEMEEE